MAGKNLDIVQLAADLDVLRKLNAQQREADEKLYRELMDVSSWWRGTSAEAMEAWAARSYAAVTAVRDETELDIESTQAYINKLAAKDRQYANKLAAFGKGNKIGTNVGTVGTGTVAGTYTMEFKNWLSQVTGISDFEANARHFERIGVPVQKVNEIYTELTKNGVTPYHIEKLKNIGVSFDNVAVSFSKLGNETDKKIYSYLMKGGDYFDDLESRKPGSWKGMLTKVNGDGELEQSTKIALIDVKEGIGAYYRNKYNISSYNNSDKNSVTAIGINERDLVILCYESSGQSNAHNLDEFFSRSGYDKNSDIRREVYAYEKYEDDIANIKFISYTAPEPYRGLFLDNVAKERIIYNSSDPNFQMNMIPFNGIVVDMDGAKEDAQGPYSTFFHELGHGMDDLMYTPGNYSSHYTENVSKYNGIENYYKDTSEVTLKQVLEYDCGQAVFDGINKNAGNLSMEDKQIVQNLLMSNREDKNAYADAYMLYLNKTDTEKKGIDQAVNTVKNDLKTNLKGEENAAASDIYGGVSFNQLKSDWGHPDNYYWRLYDGGMISREATADYFSMQMTGDVKAIESMEKNLPNASAFLDSMFTNMTKKQVIK